MYLTEKELLLNQREQLFGLQKMIKNSHLSLDEIGALIPGMVHLNKMRSLDLKYMDKKNREILGITNEEIANEGKVILRDIVKPESFQLAKELFGTMNFEDGSQIATHFQALRGFLKDGEYKWFFSVKKRFDDTLMLTISNPVSNLLEMQKQMAKILKENRFLKKNFSKVNSLSVREKEIIKLIYKGNNSNKIAEILFISPHTVSTHRKNIWRKLEISSYAELLKFAVEFDLV